MKKLLILVLVLAAGSVACAEMLYNGNLDIPDPEGYLVDGWSGWGSGSGSGWNGWGSAAAWRNATQDGTAHSGDTYMEVGVYLSTGHSSSWGWAWSALWGGPEQSNSVSAGQEVTFGAYARNHANKAGSTTQTAMLKLEWQDATGAMIDMNGDGSTNNDDAVQVFIPIGDTWTYIENVAVVPSTDYDGNPITVASVGTVWGTEATLDGNIDFDTLSLVPEPVTMALLGLGGLFIRRRK